MKIIVSHLSPDIDSITSIWLIKKFYPGWQNAQLKFVNAGQTLNNQPPDDNPDIIHVDTGCGKFDHHQTKDYTSATEKVFNFLLKNNFINNKYLPALKRMIKQINDFDHFAEVNFPQSTADYFEFLISQIIDGGLKSVYKNDEEIVKAVLPFLDGVFQVFIKKIKAETDIKNGYIFQSYWGKSIVIQSKNEEAVKFAIKSGYQLVARKDSEKKGIRIKINPNSKKTLKKLYQKIINIDKKATWFYHISGKMLLNFSSKNPNFLPSKLSLKELIEIIKSV